MKELELRVFNFLRFPLILGVLFIHNYGNIILNSYEEISGLAYLSELLKVLISQVLARLSVPIFFLMSGYLFFFNIDKFCFKSYKNKILSRIKSLVIPFVFWNLLVLLMYYIAQDIPQISSFFSGENKLIRNYKIYDFCDAIIGYSGYPISYQFWFIRDLVIVSILTPILYLFIRKLEWKGIIILFIFWFLNSEKFYIPSFAAIFFFTLGSYFSIMNLDLLKTTNLIFILSVILYPLIAIIDVFTKYSNFNIYIHNLGIILGIIFIFNIISYLIENRRVKEKVLLAEASFFIFAIHEPILTLLRKILLKVYKSHSDIFLLCVYIICPIIIVFGSVLIYCYLKKFFPVFLSFITGKNLKKYIEKI